MAFIRDNKNIVKGDELWLFVGTSTTTKPICFSTSHQLSRSLSTSSVSSKDHGNTSYVVPGEGSWTCSTEALMSIKADNAASLDEKKSFAFEELMEIFDSPDPLVYVTFGKLKNYVNGGIVDKEGAEEWVIDTPNWSGKGYITSLQASGGHGDSATMSIEITGLGPLTKNTGA